MASVSAGYASISTCECGTTSSSTVQIVPILLNGAALAALLGASAVGTGGVASLQTLATKTLTGSIRVVAVRDEQESYLNTQEKIAGIRHYLSLNTTQLAEVLNVRRPTVYQWAAVPGVPLKSKHRDRLDAIYNAARAWRMLSPVPMGSLVQEPLADGRSVYDLLCEDSLDSKIIHNAMLQAKEQQDRIQKRLTVAEVAARAGVKLASGPRTNWRSGMDI